MSQKQTVTIQIGNSDNKLSQNEWAEFITTLRAGVINISDQVHFAAASAGSDPWQNFCMVVVVDDADKLDELIAVMRKLCRIYRQDHIAVTTGSTYMVAANCDEDYYA